MNVGQGQDAGSKAAQWYRSQPVPRHFAVDVALVLIASGFVALRCASAAADTSYRIAAAKGPYFLCDRRVVEDHWLIERFVVPLRKHERNPLMERAHLWEGTGPHAGGSALRDPVTGKYLLWYSVFNANAYANRLPFSYNVCFAESEDGLAWQRPALGVFEFEGKKENNAIRLGTDKTQNIDVCFNPRPDKYPGKFLAIHNQKGGVFVSWSADGRSFTRLFENPAIAFHSDTHNNFVYDEVRDRWLLYCRPRAWAGYHRRRVALQTSPDLEHWSHERTILIPTETETPEYYGLVVFRRGDLFLGIVQIFDNTTGLMRGELCWSDDGEHWDFLPTHPAFLAVGPPGSWDAGMAMTVDSPVDVDDEMRFYYGGFRQHHNVSVGENVGAVGLALAERNRLMGLRPRSAEPGTIMTRPFLVEGRNLTVNAVIQGRLTAELRTDGNKPIPGFTFAESDPVTESGFAQPVTWRGQPLAAVPEKEVRILFKLEDAELFTLDLPESK